MMDKQEIIPKIREGSTDTLTAVYQEYREEFVGWARKTYSLELEPAKDIYQTTILIFYENIVTDKLTSLSSSLKTYIFAIGRNKIREYLRYQNKKDGRKIDWHRMADSSNEYPFANEELKALTKHLKLCLDKLGDPCRELLICYYYRNYSMNEIAEHCGYKNESTAKNSKYKCLKRLKRCMGDQSGRETI